MKFLGIFLVTMLVLAGCQQAEPPQDTTTATTLVNFPVRAADFEGTMSLNAVKYTKGRILVGGSISYAHQGERVTQRITDVPVTLKRAVSTSGLAPQQLAPQQLAPQQLAPQQLAPQQLAPQQLASQQNTTCNLLFLDLDSLFLDLLGLRVDLSPVQLSIDAMEGRDRLLGNLLCDLVRRGS